MKVRGCQFSERHTSTQLLLQGCQRLDDAGRLVFPQVGLVLFLNQPGTVRLQSTQVFSQLWSSLTQETTRPTLTAGGLVLPYFSQGITRLGRASG